MTDSIHLQKLQLLIKEEFDRRGLNGATCSEIAAALGMPRDSVSPRLRKMENAGLIRATLEQRRTLAKGRFQTVWAAAWVPVTKWEKERGLSPWLARDMMQGKEKA